MSTSAYIETATGVFIDVVDPRPEDIRLADIAWALSMQCRFGGHTKRHYSVAEHSINVSRLVPKRYALQGLMHDAAEAYLVDIPTPIKKLLPVYYEMEKKMHRVICEKLGVDPSLPPSIKVADARMCITEKLILLSPHGLNTEGWRKLTDTYLAYEEDEMPISLAEVRPADAYAAFMNRFKELKG